jgi:four helix bundle protein
MDKGYKKLIAWQVADDMALRIYRITKQFPKEELYGITSQLRRAALSVPTNIVEGMGRQGRNETRQFLNIALGSIAEVEYLIDFSGRLGLLLQQDVVQLQMIRQRAGNLLYRLYYSY